MARKTYDHRLKLIFSRTKDPCLFPDLNIPKATINHWIRYGIRDVITVKELDWEYTQLISEYEKLKSEFAQQKALSELQSFTFKVFGLQIQYKRLPNAEYKAMLLAAIKSSIEYVSLTKCLEAIGLSSPRYFSWLKRDKKCQLEDQKSCPKLSPQKLTFLEITKMKEFVTASRFVHFSIEALSCFAEKSGELYASASTWGRMIKDHNWRRPKRRLYPARPKVGIRASKVNEIWHVDMSVIKLVDGTRCFIQGVIDNFSRYILACEVSLTYSGLKTKELLEKALSRANKIGYENIPCVICDSGSENDNSHVDSLVNSASIYRLFALIQVDFSNSLIEAFFRSLKHNYLFLQDLTSLTKLLTHVEIYIEDHNKVIPHHALKKATPLEVYGGQWTSQQVNELKIQAILSRKNRITYNRSLQCSECPA